MANPDTDRSWEQDIVRRVGDTVARLRREQGLSAQRLAARTTELGHPLSRQLIADLETGRRGSRLQVAEVLVLADALDLSPVELLYPGAPDEPMPYLPGSTTTAFEALQRFTGERVGHDRPARWHLTALRRQQSLSDTWLRLRAATDPDAGGDVGADDGLRATLAARQEAVALQLVELRQSITRRGLDPGRLTGPMAHLEAMTPWPAAEDAAATTGSHDR